MLGCMRVLKLSKLISSEMLSLISLVASLKSSAIQWASILMDANCVKTDMNVSGKIQLYMNV